MSENIKNMILAAALSLVFIGLWDYFYAFPEIDKQRRAQTQQEQIAKVPQLGAPERVTAGQPPVKAAPKTRAEALALSPRIAIDTRSISGSIALKGGRIDDVSLKNYRETVDPSSPIITLLSPEDGPSPYYAELGYLTAETENAPVLPTTETLWTTDADGLTTAKPVTLTWDNGHGLVFKRVISVDDEYLFTVKDSVENKAGAAVTLFNYARVSRVGHPPSAGYAALHEGFVGVVGDDGTGSHLRQDREGGQRGQDLQGGRRLGWADGQILGGRGRSRPESAHGGALRLDGRRGEDLSGRYGQRPEDDRAREIGGGDDLCLRRRQGRRRARRL